MDNQQRTVAPASEQDQGLADPTADPQTHPDGIAELAEENAATSLDQPSDDIR